MLVGVAYGYQGSTHEAINEDSVDFLKATAVSPTGSSGTGLDIDQLLKTAGWASEGLDTVLGGPGGSKSALKWLISGGVTEDDYLSYLNHFYNPWTADLDGDGGALRAKRPGAPDRTLSVMRASRFTLLGYALELPAPRIGAPGDGPERYAGGRGGRGLGHRHRRPSGGAGGGDQGLHVPAPEARHDAGRARVHQPRRRRTRSSTKSTRCGRASSATACGSTGAT